MIMSNRIDRRTLLMLVGAGSAALVLPRTGRAAADFRFITPFTFSLAFAPVLYAKSGGFFDKEGLSVEVIGGKGAALAAQMTIAGQTEAGRTGGANYILSRVNDGAPLTSIATIAQMSPFFVLSSKKAPLTKAADMKGKTIGLASLGGSMEGTLNLMLRRAGVPTSSVNKVKVPDSGASFALVEAKRVDGFFGNTSTMIRAMASQTDATAIPVDDGIPGQVYVASPKAIAADSERFVKFLRAVHKAAAAIVDAKDLTPVIKSVSGAFSIPGAESLPIATRDLKQNADNWVAKGRDNMLRNVPEMWASAVDALAEAKMIKAKVDAKTLYTNALLDKALG
jgi:ABC-type nitrate/sulfonate/bicarbonate transport system substrate-binding protein